MNNLTRRALLQHMRKRLQALQIDEAAIEAKHLLLHALQIKPEELVMTDSQLLTSVEIDQCEALIARREAGEPLSQLLGYRDFWKDRFTVTRDVLTPRADSEALITAAVKQAKQYAAPQHILDLGTGTGCLGLSLLREFDTARATLVDRSESALHVARCNANALQLEHRCFFLQSNWVETLQSKYDMVITNPPYISTKEMPYLMPEVRDYEPALALTAGEDGLDAYRYLVREVPRILAPGGSMILELGAGQLDVVCQMATKQHWSVANVMPDLAGIARALTLTR